MYSSSDTANGHHEGQPTPSKDITRACDAWWVYGRWLPDLVPDKAASGVHAAVFESGIPVSANEYPEFIGAAARLILQEFKDLSGTLEEGRGHNRLLALKEELEKRALTRLDDLRAEEDDMIRLYLLETIADHCGAVHGWKTTLDESLGAYSAGRIEIAKDITKSLDRLGWKCDPTLKENPGTQTFSNVNLWQPTITNEFALETLDSFFILYRHHRFRGFSEPRYATEAGNPLALSDGRVWQRAKWLLTGTSSWKAAHRDLKKLHTIQQDKVRQLTESVARINFRALLADAILSDYYHYGNVQPPAFLANYISESEAEVLAAPQNDAETYARTALNLYYCQGDAERYDVLTPLLDAVAHKHGASGYKVVVNNLKKAKLYYGPGKGASTQSRHKALERNLRNWKEHLAWTPECDCPEEGK